MANGRVSAAELKIRRFINMQAGNPRRLRKRPPMQLFPRGPRLLYQQRLERMIREIYEVINTEVIEALPRITQEAQILRGDAARFDGPSDEIRKALDRVALIMGESVAGDESITLLAEDIAAATSAFNRGQLNKQFISTLGVDIAAGEPYLAEQIRLFVADNTRLIRSLTETPLRETEGILQRGIRRGLRHEQIATEIHDRAGVHLNRARLIARDQTAKLNGELTQLRQQNIGITRYVWSTSNDERVRESHAALDGTVHSWNDPPEVDGERVHPGQAINCRCTAIPVVADLL